MKEQSELIEFTEDVFYEKFSVAKNHLDNNAAFDGCMFETFGEELEYVKTLPANKILTIVEADSNWYYLLGFHYVNRMGYLVLLEPYEGPEFQVKLDDL